MRSSAVRVAVLMTCHNRREETLASLGALFKQEFYPEVELKVYLVDDGSTDGTSEAILSSYPEVRVLKGDGSLFWNGGMRLAFSEASRGDYDYYLWLNDDTMLYHNAIEELLSTHHYLINHSKPDSIIVGQAQDPITGVQTYGGVISKSRWWPLKFTWLDVSEEPLECETMDGNCVLIPRGVAKLVGNLDKAFTHGMGDWDYGLRARKLGCSVWVAPGYMGSCSRNPASVNWLGTDLPLLERLKKVNQPKGLPPREWMAYASRHAGSFWFLYWLSPYIYLFIGPALKKIRRKKQGI